MLNIEKTDHIGIRVSDKAVSIVLYERLGFDTLSDTRFEKGRPVIMRHPSGVVLNRIDEQRYARGLYCNLREDPVKSFSDLRPKDARKAKVSRKGLKFRSGNGKIQFAFQKTDDDETLLVTRRHKGKRTMEVSRTDEPTCANRVVALPGSCGTPGRTRSLDHGDWNHRVESRTGRWQCRDVAQMAHVAIARGPAKTRRQHRHRSAVTHHPTLACYAGTSGPIPCEWTIR